MTELADVALELYGAPLGDFVSTRASLAREAKAAKDRELASAIGSLRKPTVAAWAVNLLVRHHPDEVAGLLALGAQLREAQARLAGNDLRTLDRQRHQVVAAMVRRAAALTSAAGQRLSDPVAQQVEGTLRAAMTDPAAATVVLSGLLTRELTSTGFDPVDLTDASALPDATPLPEPPPGRHLHAVPDPEPARAPARKEATDADAEEAAATRTAAEARAAERRAAAEARRAEQERARRRRETEADLHAAEREAATAGRALTRAQDAVRSRTDRADELADQVRATREQIRTLTAQLEAQDQQATAAAADLEAAEQQRDAASDAADAAQTALAEAQDALADL